MFTETHIPALLTDFRTKNKERRGSVQALRVRLSSHGDDQKVLDAWALATKREGVLALFQGPETPWKVLTLEGHTPVTLSVLMGSEELSFPATLVGVKVARVWDSKADADKYTYTFDLEKDLDPAADKDLPHLVKARNERGDLIEWPILWELRSPTPEAPEAGEAGQEDGQEEG